MKFTFFGQFENNPYADLEEKAISEALKKLGHIVYKFDVATADVKKLLEQANKSDFFLFYNGGVITKEPLDLYIGITGLSNLLKQITSTKIMWYFDRILEQNNVFVEKILPFVDYAFLNDDTWVRRHKWKNTYGLHMGATEKPLGQFRKDLECDIAFVGKIYGGRGDIIVPLKQKYGKKMRIFGNIWGKDFDDLCQSAKVMFQPKWLNNDFCWGQQIYQVLGAGGFLVHPRLYGLQEEGFIEGEHYVGYTIYEELLAGLDFFLKPENTEKRKQVAMQGRNYVLSFFTWEQKIKQVLQIIKDNTIKKNADTKN